MHNKIEPSQTEKVSLTLIKAIKEYNRLIEKINHNYDSINKKTERRKKAINKIEHLLKHGKNPDSPETVFINDYFDMQCAVKIHPLHMAIDEYLTLLLLKYGANQNIRGYYPRDNDSKYVKSYNYITALEGACLECDYKKVMALLSFIPSEINIDAIEESLSIMLYKVNEPYSSYYDPRLYITEEYIINKTVFLAQLEVIRKLSEKSSAKLLIGLLKAEQEHEKRALDIIHLMPEKQPCDVYDWYDLISKKIDIYTHSLIHKLWLPIYFVLFAGHSQKHNELNTIPDDVLKLIIIKLFQTNVCETAIPKQTQPVFKTPQTFFVTKPNNTLEDTNNFTCTIC